VDRSSGALESQHDLVIRLSDPSDRRDFLAQVLDRRSQHVPFEVEDEESLVRCDSFFALGLSKFAGGLLLGHGQKANADTFPHIAPAGTYIANTYAWILVGRPAHSTGDQHHATGKRDEDHERLRGEVENAE
jgi:hypothetical protein